MPVISSNRKRMRRGSRVLLEGKIITPNGTVIEVKIRELGPTGAILRISPDVKLPKNFDLLLVSDGTHYPAEKRWRKGERLVIKFVRYLSPCKP